MAEETKYDEIIKILKNNKLVISIVITFTVLVAVGKIKSVYDIFFNGDYDNSAVKDSVYHKPIAEAKVERTNSELVSAEKKVESPSKSYSFKPNVSFEKEEFNILWENTTKSLNLLQSSNNDQVFLVSFDYSGELKENKYNDLFYYTGGEVVLKINGQICLEDFIHISSTHKSGNSKDFILNLIHKTIDEKVSNDFENITNRIIKCIR